MYVIYCKLHEINVPRLTSDICEYVPIQDEIFNLVVKSFKLCLIISICFEMYNE